VIEPSLFDNLQPSRVQPMPPHARHSATSHDAAIKARRFIGEQGERVLAWFKSRGLQGGTQIEASAALGIGRPSMCARVNALEHRGDLTKTDARRGNAAVYLAKDRP
jgi:hypothetical protein